MSRLSLHIDATDRPPMLPLRVLALCVAANLAFTVAAHAGVFDGVEAAVRQLAGGALRVEVGASTLAAAVVLALIVRGAGPRGPSIGVRWSDIAIALGVGAVTWLGVQVAAVAIAAVVEQGAPSVRWPTETQLLLQQALIQAPYEEALYRGLLLSQLVLHLGAAVARPHAAALAVSSLVFAVGHLPGDLAQQSTAGAVLVLFAQRAFMGVVYGGLVLLGGRLLAVAAVHAVCNVPNPIVELPVDVRWPPLRAWALLIATVALVATRRSGSRTSWSLSS